MASVSEGKEIGYPGGTLRLNISLKDPITKQFANADSLPTITITDPITNLVIILNAPSVNSATGRYYYDYVIATNASIATGWKATWTLVYKGFTSSATELFEIASGVTVAFGDDIFDPDTVVIDAVTLSRIKTIAGFPRITNQLLTDTEIKQYAILPALNTYFARFPEKKRESYQITNDLVVPFPNLIDQQKEVYGLASVRIASQESTGSSSAGGDFWQLVYYNTIGGGAMGSPSAGKYGTPYTFESGNESYFSQKQMYDSMTNLGTKSFFVNAPLKQLEVSTTISGKLIVTWAIRSLNFANVRFSRVEDVIELCQSNLLQYMSTLTGIIDDANLQKKFNYDLMQTTADKLRDRVMTKWDEFPHILLLKPE